MFKNLLKTTTNDLPPGQYEVKNWPVLSASRALDIRDADWILSIDGLVENPVKLTLQDLYNLPKTEGNIDFHCVTTWSMLDTAWTGVAWSVIEDLVKPKVDAKYVLQYSNDEIAYTTGTLRADLQKPDVIIGYEHNGKPIPREHGGPIRIINPHLYAYKSAKWLCRLEFLADRKLGFWEERGYSEQADPLKEQRYTEDDDFENN